ncbi:MAG TPA: electron transfer flavoprotein subunit beta/FixA family protein [Thiobacillus sp.]|nr:MAG: EtfB protein [Hydrogenophilales bacterium 16-64-40]OZA34309.1 MAG: EtfB protein [Hydrogenophilales bacterium 17-64-65]HQS82201.1 electron transfer flavoprotein subunit beta/FixA family protein [Thiobacillus sp.]HQT32972.1 electron transfer flavoprotein subunit beta/FixA family protein [Thiobacillus sp.]
MKLLVAVKRVVDHNIKVHIKPDGSNVELAGARMSINPFDENAMEAAMRLKESGAATEVVAVTVGTTAAQDVLRHALAMGADRAILLESSEAVQPLGVARLLKVLVEREQPGLVLLGKQSIDDDTCQTGQMLAALLDYGQGTFISALNIENGEAVVTREIEGGTEKIAVKLPAVLTADLRLNEPRYVKLPNLMMAKKKPIQTISASEFGIDVSPRLALVKVADPPARKACVMVNNVQELVEKLRSEARVLP